MLDKDFLNDLIAIVEKHDLGGSTEKNKEIANSLFEHYKALPMLLNDTERESENGFIDRMYGLYPTKCPKRKTSLGKSHKDKQRIKKLLKTYSMEQIELVFKHEIEEKYGKQYMQNFSTFLNNFPDPDTIEEPLNISVDHGDGESKSHTQIVINGQIYR